MQDSDLEKPLYLREPYISGSSSFATEELLPALPRLTPNMSAPKQNLEKSP